MKGWRTLIFNGAVAILGIVVTFDWSTVIPPEYMGITLIIVAAANGVFRGITTTPVGEK